jgi:hypothetical protein
VQAAQAALALLSRDPNAEVGQEVRPSACFGPATPAADERLIGYGTTQLDHL